MSAHESLQIMIDGERVAISPAILEKYNQPGPRYTSYPTAPEWNDRFGPEEWQGEVAQASAAPLSLYFHFPFCQSLCLFCGCNVVISKKPEVAIPYLAHLQQEIEWVSAGLDRRRQIEQLHWGGGTPTYLSAAQIAEIYRFIQDHFTFAPAAEIGVEVDPRATTREQCRVLRQLGFNRLSLGVQDFNPLVQQTVHRVQPYELTRARFDDCRALGFDSINIDLIYGLPHQTAASFSETVDKIIELNPDRIAVFSYAHVPWLKKQQGSFAKHLPRGSEKFRIFSLAITKLTDAGYRYIGLDHFAKPDDELCRARDGRTLHRNFQGYTTKAGCDLYGFGVSAISGLPGAYAQNWRDLPQYYAAIEAGRWPTMRGMRLTAEDQLRRAVINRLLCHEVVIKAEIEREFGIGFDEHFAAELERLRELERDGLARVESDRIHVAALGRIFIRNVAMVFDAYLRAPAAPQPPIFSRTL
jgi:oxygen-independent coproporphyrinogen-3 oxidase